MEEMCYAFPVFYPRAADGSSLAQCLSDTSLRNFDTYVIK